jgi:hypothetical protein
MKKIILLFFFVIIFGCKKEPIYNNYDEITHYSITDKIAEKFDTVTRFKTIYGSIHSHEINLNKFEEELLSFGYQKNELNKNKIKQVDSFISNNILYDLHLTACIPSYRDIFILKKNKKVIAALKICFDCSMVDSYGKINSSFEEKDLESGSDNYFNDFEKFQKTLTNKN